MSTFFLKLSRLIIICGGIFLILSYCEKDPSESQTNHISSFAQYAETCKTGNNSEILELQKDLKYFDSQSKILGKSIVIDTLLTGIIERNSKYYIRTYREFLPSKKIYVFLECEKSVIDKVRTFESLHVLVTANINRIDKSYVYKIITTFDDSNEYIYVEDEYYLFGKCSEIAPS